MQDKINIRNVLLIYYLLLLIIPISRLIEGMNMLDFFYLIVLVGGIINLFYCR